MRVAGSRLLSTAASTSSNRSRSNASRVLIAAALAAPVGFGAYKWQYDSEFKASVQKALNGELFKSAPKPSVRKTPQEPPVVPPTAIPAAPDAKPDVAAAPEVEDVKISMAELDELERILIPQTSVTYKKEEVAEVEKKIAEAEEAANKKVNETAESEKPEEETLKSEGKTEEVKVTQEPPKPVEAPAQAPPDPTQEAVDALREAAKRIETEAAEASKAELAKAEAAVRSDIEKVLAKDLGSLNEEGLRERVVQLTLELKDRNRWEAIRLHEVVTKTIEDISRKYLTMMKEQEAAYERLIRAEVSNAATEATVATEERLSKSLQDRLARQKQALAAEMDLHVERARDEERQSADAERKQRISLLQDMEKKLLEFEAAIKERDRARLELLRNKRAMQAALKFSRVIFLDKASPAEVEQSLSELRLATAGDAIVSETLDTLPHRVFASGVPSLHKLARTFEKDVKPDLVQSSLIPEDASLVQQALARATAALMITSKPSASPLPDDDTPDARCARVLHFLDKEDLVSAVSELQSLPPKMLEKSAFAKDWLSQAQDRLKVEAAIRLLTARFEAKQ